MQQEEISWVNDFCYVQTSYLNCENFCRQWVLKEFSLWSSELEYVDSLLKRDLRNNSAWNQRFFVIYSTTGFTPDVIAREVTWGSEPILKSTQKIDTAFFLSFFMCRYAQEYISKAPNNESPWSYMRGWVFTSHNIHVRWIVTATVHDSVAWLQSSAGVQSAPQWRRDGVLREPPQQEHPKSALAGVHDRLFRGDARGARLRRPRCDSASGARGLCHFHPELKNLFFFF